MSHLKHASSDGNLLHGPNGHLVRACGGETCACAAEPVCTNCPDATPAQFHVTFMNVTLCGGCVPCAAMGVSLQLAGGAAINGTYVMAHNGACAWTTFATDVPASATLYPSVDCTWSATPITFAIQQVRISATQFQLQITDDSNTILLFNATVTTSTCCTSYTVDNALTECGCVGDGTIALGTGGTAVVTAC